VTGQQHGAGARISPGGQQFRGDDGSADPAVTAAMAAFWTGRGSEHAALTALSDSRLLVPVVAILGASDPGAGGKGGGNKGADGKGPGGKGAGGGGDKDSEMALPKLSGHDGRPAIVAFTGLAALTRWRPDARPVPAEALRVWQAAVAESCAVVIDVAGPVPLAVEGARLAAMAAGQPPPLPHQDPDIVAAIAAAVDGVSVIAGFRLEPGSPQDGSGLAVRLQVAGRGAVQMRQAAERIADVLAARVRAVEITTE
jgi:hypothetical protein